MYVDKSLRGSYLGGGSLASGFASGASRKVSLIDLLKSIDKAAVDDRVVGITVRLGKNAEGKFTESQLQSVAARLRLFQESKKAQARASNSDSEGPEGGKVDGKVDDKILTTAREESAVVKKKASKSKKKRELTLSADEDAVRKSANKFTASVTDTLDSPALTSFFLSSCQYRFMERTGSLPIAFLGVSATVPYLGGVARHFGIELDQFVEGQHKSAFSSIVNAGPTRADFEAYGFWMRDMERMRYEAVADNIPRLAWNGNSTADTAAVLEDMSKLSFKFDAFKASSLLATGIIQGVGGRNAVLEWIKECHPEASLVSMPSYVNSVMKKTPASQSEDCIAIISLAGSISRGRKQFSSKVPQSSDLLEYFEAIKKSDHIKGVLLHVDSPGGCPVASDSIRSAIKDCDVPVYCAMGEMAASGGYYVASPCDKIIAMPTTITGSIGVFGVKPNISKMLKEKLGLHVEEFGTSDDLGMDSMVKSMTRAQKKTVEASIAETYSMFKNVVSEDRNIPLEEVEKLAGGRVFTGRQALNVGLVDELGDVNHAIESLIKEVGSDNPKIVFLPQPMSKFDELMSLFKNVNDFANARVHSNAGKNMILGDIIRVAEDWISGNGGKSFK